jgi:2-phosphosulfolactate phosphatase
VDFPGGLRYKSSHMNLHVILTPAELPALAGRDLRGTACVVFDILRATSTFVTALHHGATAIVPVSEIAEAVARRKKQPDVLLAGERNGVRISAALTGEMDFDLGNSPREFTPEKVHGKTIVSTTTNGTRALRACAQAKTVLAASFLNLAATADFLRGQQEIILVCSGTGTGTALEDVLAAGALVEKFMNGNAPRPALSDAAEIARQTFARMETDLAPAIGSSQNGRRLRAIPGLCADVAFCAQRDVFNLVAAMDAEGRLRKI